MPDDLQALRKKKFEPTRVSRIQQLAKQWNVPTQNIHTTVNWGYDTGIDIPDRTDYFTLDSLGALTNRKIDYAPVKGYPAGTYIPAGKPIPVMDPAAVLPGMTPIGKLPPVKLPPGVKPVMKKGGAIKNGRKAQYGDILPVGRNRKISSELENTPVSPLPVRDMQIADYFNNPQNRRLIPNDASVNGPEPEDQQYYIDGKNGQMYQDGDQGPVPIAANAGRSGFNMSLNAGAVITGVNSAINSLYDKSRGIKEFSRLKRKQLQDSGYNPYQYGTGSQAIYRNGGSLTPVGGNSISGNNPMLQFNGPSHENGGIPINYAGQNVEVEGGETAYQDRAGDLNIFGDLTIPGSTMKFKTAGKKIGALEAMLSKKLSKAKSLMAENDPTDKFERLSYNTGKLQIAGASRDQAVLTSLKENLSHLQEKALLADGNNSGSKAKHGYIIAQDGTKVRKPSMAERHNNPGNIKYAGWLAKKYGATKGDKSSDGDNFAVFPSKQAGLQAMKALLKGPGYKSRSVEDAISRWTNSEGYKIDIGDLKGKKVGSLNNAELEHMMNVITQGEDSKLYDLDFLFTNKPKDPVIDASIHPPKMTVAPLNLPQGPGTYTNNPPDSPEQAKVPGKNKVPLTDIDNPGSPARPGHPNPLAFSQYGPELLALGERPDFVPGQRYEPNLFAPYQVTFQDKLNENAATFNRVAMQSGNNPSALSILAGQKYIADSAVLGDEFRTNQGITNDITNKNISLLNDAQLKNLQLADTQFVRQSQAVANTRQNINNAINSISSKIAQNRLETRGYNALSSMFPQYNFDNNGNIEYQPNEEMSFGAGADISSPEQYYQRTRNEYDGSGKLRKKVVNTPSDAEQAKLEYQNWNNSLKKRMSLLTTSRRLKSTS
ncbi:hypothetical protein SAMN05428988_3227 [Chitinophaga sp. YR573]|uniref:hypothetical protein n=1 Tax=Chitinophaga sp. YR573 TaxID=1881040 RepID=UPI0008B0F126|nr:hypothetical protein [Chitinophaga sp. YR573]SEW21584.1 hypothetical protein SAMN05428988_3227 [Chitinophaga sp. YR573]